MSEPESSEREMNKLVAEAKLSAESLTWLEASTEAMRLATQIATGTEASFPELVAMKALQALATKFKARHDETQKALRKCL